MFLLFLHEKITKDCGFLTSSAAELPGKFALKDIVGIEPDISRDRFGNKTIHISTYDDKKVLGRHQSLKEPRTWIYPNCTVNGRNMVFKFQWVSKANLESSIHRFVLAKGVLNVPKLLYTASVANSRGSGASSSFVGEVLVIENVGSQVSSLFDGPNHGMVVDIFAAYAHTLIAAAKVDEDNQFVLHRDVSLGNLMVTSNGRPYVIDWGYGCVCKRSSTANTAPGKVIIGTTIYMGIRILYKCRTRSVVEDLESLFLIFCHCIWRTYGNAKCDLYKDLWKSSNLFRVKITREFWLKSKISLFEHMEIRGDSRLPKAYRLLAEGMYDLLFPPSSPIASFNNNSDDDP
ncbi:hypothetical protein EV175_006791, partial [Coemansia sp. RSA 1933]